MGGAGEVEEGFADRDEAPEGLDGGVDVGELVDGRVAVVEVGLDEDFGLLGDLEQAAEIGERGEFGVLGGGGGRGCDMRGGGGVRTVGAGADGNAEEEEGDAEDAGGGRGGRGGRGRGGEGGAVCVVSAAAMAESGRGECARRGRMRAAARLDNRRRRSRLLG